MARGPAFEHAHAVAAAIRSGGKYAEVALMFGISEPHVARICRKYGVRSVRAEAYKSTWQHLVKRSSCQNS